MRKTLQAALFLAAITATSSVWAQEPAAPVPPASVPAAPGNTEIPVKTVVLFSSGVGYFEHFGSVKGDGSTELRFKTNQINDILKSLVLQDLDGGKVTTVSYPSLDPLVKTLKSFQVDITTNPPLADLLNQLRGAKVTVTAGAEKLVGSVLGVEKRTKTIGDKNQTIEEAVLNLISGGKIVSQPLQNVTSIELQDPVLQDELNRALMALAGARDQDKKPVKIGFGGQGDHRVRIGYVVETPIWKTSYRLIMGPPAAKPGDAPATQPAGPAKVEGNLQGWAIVENQTDNDWNNVQLSLVSGRPISFIEDLYQPLYIPRPVVQPELYASLRPQTYAAGMDKLGEPDAAAFGKSGGGGGGEAASADEDRKMPMATRQMAQQMNGGMMTAGGYAGRAVEKRSEDLKKSIDATASVGSLASASSVGELFEYTVGSVSLPRQRSAMIPIITDPIEVERLSIYNMNVLPRNPLNGARVKNTTNKHLLAGPVTVLDGATYAGDAQIDNVPPNQERFLSYGVDLQMLIDAKERHNDSQLQTGKIVKGVLYISTKNVMTQQYLAENKSDHDKTLIVEHPRHGGWSLVDTDKPMETTDNLYRFKGVVAAGKSSKLVVKEEVVQQQVIAILPSDLGTLDFYSKAGQIPQNVRDSLGQAIQLRQAMVDTQRQIDQDRAKLQEVTAEQNRIRENMKTVNQNSQYYTRLMTKLNDQETEIEKTQTETDALQKTLNAQRQALETFLSSLNVG